MAAFIDKIEHECSERTRINPETTVSKDTQDHVLLRFSGLTWQQRSHIVSNSGNAYVLGKFKTALRAQFRDIHAPTSSSRREQTNGKGKGGDRYRSRFRDTPKTGGKHSAYNAYADFTEGDPDEYGG